MTSDRVFPSAVDRWLAVVLLLIAALVPIFLLQAMAIADTEPGAAAGLVASAIFVVVVFAGLLWPVRYTCATDVIVVRSGFIRYRVPYREIRRLTPSRAAWSSPALSMQRLRIDYGTRWLLISPADRTGFLAELQHRAPQLRPTPEGGLSANIE